MTRRRHCPRNWKPKRPKKPETKVKQQINESIQLTTIPGLTQIIRCKNSPIRQIFWFLVIIGTTFMGIYQISNPWTDYFSLKVVEEIEREPWENIP